MTGFDLMNDQNTLIVQSMHFVQWSCTSIVIRGLKSFLEAFITEKYLAQKIHGELLMTALLECIDFVDP